MKTLIIINDAPYGTEKAYSALRIPNQNTPNAYYNIERMLTFSTSKGARLLLCGSCLDARGLKNRELVEKAEISTMAELTRQILENDKVLTF